MPTMTRAHYNLIADATHAIIGEALKALPKEAIHGFQSSASRIMSDAVAGISSQVRSGRFRERCLGIRGSR